MNIYVGNLAFGVVKEELQNLFEQHGEVSSVNIITDKYTGKSKGFGFVEMGQQSQAESAISQLNGLEFKGRNIIVNEARPKTENNGGGGSNNRFNKRRY